MFTFLGYCVLAGFTVAITDKVLPPAMERSYDWDNASRGIALVVAGIACPIAIGILLAYGVYVIGRLGIDQMLKVLVKNENQV